MRIKLLVDIAGPMGVFGKGQDVDLEKKMATALLDRGYAEPFEVVLPPVADTTDLSPEPMADDSAPRRRGVRKS